MKNPDRHICDDTRCPRIASAAKRNRRCEEVRSLRDQVPRSITAVRLPCDIDAGGVNAVLRFDGFKDLDDERQFLADLVESANPCTRTLRNQYERRILCLVLRLRP